MTVLLEPQDALEQATVAAIIPERKFSTSNPNGSML